MERKKLREWLALEDIRAGLLKATEKKDFGDIASQICSYISAASGEEWDFNKPWWETIAAYGDAVKANLPTLEFPILKTREKGDKLPWEYKGRAWYFWLHLFSSHYGWTGEQIAELDIDTAVGLLQEIMIEEQLHKEWEWMTCELAYPYDEATKKQHFQPLQRPDWMQPITPVQKIKIPVRMMPVGNVIGEENGS